MQLRIPLAFHLLRERFFKASDTDAFDTVGADRAWDDGLQDEDVLLAPAIFYDEPAGKVVALLPVQALWWSSAVIS